jgi:hypothetical protein
MSLIIDHLKLGPALAAVEFRNRSGQRTYQHVHNQDVAADLIYKLLSEVNALARDFDISIEKVTDTMNTVFPQKIVVQNSDENL